MKTTRLFVMSFACLTTCLIQNVAGADLSVADATALGGGQTNPLLRVVQTATAIPVALPATNINGISRNIIQPAAPPLGVMRTEQMAAMDSISVSSPILNVDFTDENGSKIGPAAIGQSANDFWNRSITKSNPGTVTFNNLYWSDGSASTIDLTVQNAPGHWGNGVADPMYNDYVYSWNGQSTFATLAQIPTNTYDLYVYGHSPGDAGNGLFKLRKNGVLIGYRGTTVWGHLWASTDWMEGEQYIVFRNVSVTPGDTLQIEVVPVGGCPMVAGLQLAPSVAIDKTPPAMQNLINIDTHGAQGAKTGPAAVGPNRTNFWNVYNQPYANPGVLQNLHYADNTTSGVGLIVQNAPGQWDFGPIDPMYDGYIYPWNGANISATVTNLPNGLYDFYVYTHAGGDTGNGVVHLTCNGADYGTRGTTYWGSGWATANWEEGQQYTVFRNVLVVDGNPVQLTVSPYQQWYTYLNGMQILERPEDSDGNGLPDWWELKCFGSLGADSKADPDGDGISNFGEYQRGSNPTNAYTFNGYHKDAEYLLTSAQFDPFAKAYLDIGYPQNGNYPITVSGADANALYDLYFVPNLSYQRWQWRRVYTGIQCDNSGYANITIHQPDPNQGFFEILDAADHDGDGLTDGYEAWFTYGPNGVHTDPYLPDTDQDKMGDNWEVEYGLNPTSAAGNDGADANPDNDLDHDLTSLTNLKEHDYAGGYFGDYDPLEAYGTSANRPVVSVYADPNPPACTESSFTIYRDAGYGGNYDSPLTVYYALGGTLSYDPPNGDYTLNPAPLGWPRIYSAVIPAADPDHGIDGHSVTVTVNAPGAGGNPLAPDTVNVSLTPYSVSPQSQVSDPYSWAYVLDWHDNRATIYFTYDSSRPTADNQLRVTDVTRPINITLTGTGCSLPLSFAVDTQPGLGALSGTPPNLVYTPSTAGQGDAFLFHTVDSQGRHSIQARVTIDVLPLANLRASGNCGSIGLEWTIPWWARSYVQDFVVYRSTTPGAYPGTPFATLPATSRSYLDTTAASGQAYYYVVTFHYRDLDGSLHELPSNEASAAMRSPPVTGPTDIVFIIDNTGSMGNLLLANLRERINSILDCVQAGSGNDYRLALVTPDDDQVDVRLQFGNNNRMDFVNALNRVTRPPSDGNGTPESTDECLNTVVNSLSDQGRADPRNCSNHAGKTLQVGTFTGGFRANAVNKWVVMITDAPPGGFCDLEDGGAKAHDYAYQAYANCIKINAIMVADEGYETFDPAAQVVMKDYYHTACGWYSEVPYDGGDIVSAVLKMVYENSYCNCQ